MSHTPIRVVPILSSSAMRPIIAGTAGLRRRAKAANRMAVFPCPAVGDQRVTAAAEALGR